MRTSSLVLSVAVLAVLLATGCGVGDEPQTVEERAQGRWDLLVERDFAQAWNYHTPGFRETTPREDFVHDMRSRPIRWHAAEVQNSICEDDRCTVIVSVTYQAVAAPGPQSQMRLTRNIEEQWVRLDGHWWHLTN